MPAMTSDEHPPGRTTRSGPDYYSSEDSANHEPHSPCPPSTSSSDAESDPRVTCSLPRNYGLHTSITTIPENRLREIVIKLVDQNPGFQHAVAKEIRSPSACPGSLRRRRLRTSKRPRISDTVIPEKKCANCAKPPKCSKTLTLLRPESGAFHARVFTDSQPVSVEQIYSLRSPGGGSLRVLVENSRRLCGQNSTPCHDVELLRGRCMEPRMYGSCRPCR